MKYFRDNLKIHKTASISPRVKHGETVNGMWINGMRESKRLSFLRHQYRTGLLQKLVEWSNRRRQDTIWVECVGNESGPRVVRRVRGDECTSPSDRSRVPWVQATDCKWIGESVCTSASSLLFDWKLYVRIRRNPMNIAKHTTEN